MSQRQYYLDLFTYQTWQEFKAAGAKVTGFRENRWNSVKSMQQGDFLLCYLTGVSRWIGILEVTGPAFQSSEKIWSAAPFSARVPVRVVAELEPETAVPVLQLKEQLSFFKDLKSPHAWTGWFRGSPAKWSSADGDAIVKAILAAVQDPVVREVDRSKLKKTPPILLQTSSGKSVTVPQEDAPDGSTDVPSVEPRLDTLTPGPEVVKEESAHTEIQWLLAKLGNDIGLDIWIAKNDKNKTYMGNAFSALPRLRAT